MKGIKSQHQGPSPEDFSCLDGKGGEVSNQYKRKLRFWPSRKIPAIGLSNMVKGPCKGGIQQYIAEEGIIIQRTNSEKYRTKNKEKLVGVLRTSWNSLVKDSKLKTKDGSVLGKRGLNNFAQEQQMELISELSVNSSGNGKQGIVHNQMEGSIVIDSCNLDGTTCHFPDKKLKACRSKRKKSGLMNANSLSIEKEQNSFNDSGMYKVDIVSDIVRSRTEDCDYRLQMKTNWGQCVEYSFFQKRGGGQGKEGASDVSLPVFSEDHTVEVKMGHKCNTGDVAIDTEENVDTGAPSSSQMSSFQRRIPVDDYNSICEICKVGGELLCCDGEGCLLTYHRFCLDPPLDQVPSGDWLCPTCLYKKTSSDLLSVPPVVESIWDLKESDVIDDAPSECIIMGNDSGKRQRTADKSIGREHIAQDKNDYFVPTVRKNTASNAVQGPDKGLNDRSSPNLIDGESDVYKVNSKRKFKQEMIYFVKYKGLSHVHNRWVSESQVLKEAPKKLACFKRNVQQGKALKWNPQWTEPHRLIRKRALKPPENSLGECHDKLNCKVEWLVKWRGLGYDQCTWEMADSNILASTSANELMKSYEQRSRKAQQRAFPGRLEKVKKLRDAAYLKLKELPTWIKRGSNSHPQLESINNLRKFWKTHQNAMIVDEFNQERILTTISFILSLIKEFEVVRPILIVTSSTTLSSWEYELSQCDQLVNFVVYGGNRNSREFIRKMEFYEESGYVMAEIVLSTYDVVHMDLQYLKPLEWEALVVDDCHRLKLPKSLYDLDQLLVDFRLVLISEAPKDNSFDLSNLLPFLDMKMGHFLDTPKEHEDQERKEEGTQMEKRIKDYIIYEHTSDNLSRIKLIEHWVPVEFTDVQVELYCKTLIKNSDSLCLCSKIIDSAELLRDVLLSLRKCCNHPYLVDQSLENSLTKSFPENEYLDVGIKASGKLQILDHVLSELKVKGQRLLILFQIVGRSGHASIGDILDDHLRQRLGAESYERVDSGLATAKKQAALQRFNCKDSGRFVFLLEKRACGPNIKLSSIDSVIIFDSDWNPLNDLRALEKAHIDTNVEHLNVFRFYSPQTVEERLLVAAKRGTELDNNFENFSATLCHQLLRWGAVQLFQNYDKVCALGGPSLSSQCLYNGEDLKTLIKAMIGDKLNGPNLDDTLWNSLVPRISRNHGYGKGILLLGELKNQLTGKEKEPSNIFWTSLLTGRHADSQGPISRLQRSKKKVQYSERRPSRLVHSRVKQELKIKRRRVGDTLDPISISSWLRDTKKLLESEKERDGNATDIHQYVAEQVSYESAEDGSGKSKCKDKNLSPKAMGIHQYVDDQVSHESTEVGSGKSNCNDRNLSPKATDIHQYVSDQVTYECTEDGSGKSNCKDTNLSPAVQTEKHLSSSSASCDGMVEVSKSDDETINGKLSRKTANYGPHSAFTVAEKSLSDEYRGKMSVLLHKEDPNHIRVSSCMSSAEGSAHQIEENKKSEDNEALKSTQQNLYIRMKSEIVQLCHVLHLPEGVTKVVESSLVNVINNYQLFIKQRSLAQAIEICTCLAVASSLKYEMDIEASLELAKSQLNFECTKGEVNLVYGKLSEKILNLYRRIPSTADSGSNSQIRKSANWNNADDRYSDNNRACNDEHARKLMHFSSSQSVTDLHNSTGLDVHPHERMEGTGNFKARTKPGTQGESNTTYHVEEHMNCHPEKPILTAREHGIDLPNQFDTAEFDSDSRSKELSQCQMNGFPSENCAEKCENIHAIMQKEQSEVLVSCKQFDRKQQRLNNSMNNCNFHSSDANPETITKVMKQEKDHAQKCRELDKQTTGREKNNRISNLVLKDITVERVPLQSFSDINFEPRTGLSSVQALELPQNGMESASTMPSSLDIDKSRSQGHKSNYLQDCESNHSRSSKQHLLVPSREIMKQAQQASDLTNFTDNFSTNQSQQCDSMNISESQHLHHTFGVSEVLVPIEPSQPLQGIYIAAGSSVAAATETVPVTYQPSTMSVISNSSSFAGYNTHSIPITTSLSPRLLQTNLADPLSHEMLRIAKENEEIKKLYEEKLAQIKAKFQEEFEELGKKYDGLLREEQHLFEQKKRNLESIYFQIDLNHRLAEAFRLHARREKNSTASVAGSVTQWQHVQHATNSSSEYSSQLFVPTFPSELPTHVPDRFTASTGVQVNGALPSQSTTQNCEAYASCLQLPISGIPGNPTQCMEGIQDNASFLSPVSDMCTRKFQGTVGSSTKPLASVSLLDHSQTATVPPMQVKHQINNSEISGVIYLLDDD